MSTDTPKWVEALELDDLNFIRRFVLASGSLKEMAEQYSVSYPTMRARLDELIAKLQAAPKPPEGALKQVVRELIAEGVLEVATARKLIAANKKDIDAMERANAPQKSRNT